MSGAFHWTPDVEEGLGRARALGAEPDFDSPDPRVRDFWMRFVSLGHVLVVYDEPGRRCSKVGMFAPEYSLRTVLEKMESLT